MKSMTGSPLSLHISLTVLLSLGLALLRATRS